MLDRYRASHLIALSWRRSALAHASAVLAVVSVGISTAWACAAQPLLVIHPQASGASRSTATVIGQAFSNPVEIRWNALDGPLLARLLPDAPSAQMTIPDVPPGIYAVIGVERVPGGAVGNTARASFQVAAPKGKTNQGMGQPASNSREDGAWGFWRVVAVALGAVALVALGSATGAWAAIRFRPEPSRAL